MAVRKQDIDNVKNRLLVASNEIKNRIQKCELAKQELDEVELNLNIYKTILEQSEVTISELKIFCKAVETYIAHKKNNSKELIKDAIKLAKSVINSTEDYSVVIEDDVFTILNSQGLPLKEADGMGFCSLLSAFLSIMILKATGTSTIVLDERFAFVRADKTALLANMLANFEDSMQFICIEQKPEIKNAAKKVYTIEKVGKVTRIANTHVNE